MWPFSYISYWVRRLITSHFGAVIIFILMLYMIKSGKLWRVYRRIRSALTTVRGRASPLTLQFGDPAYHIETGRTAWELRKESIGVYSIQGRRPHMEDRFNVVELDQINASIYGVFDGHGGQFAVDFAEKTLSKALMKRLLTESSVDADVDTKPEQPNLSHILTEEILKVDRQLLEIQTAAEELSGTTALVAVVRGNELVVANVGDSRGVMFSVDGKALPLSFDHKPNDAKERARIDKAGGFVQFNGVWRVVGVLAMSRAIGDFPLKEHNIVIADPDILSFDLASDLQPQFMILATDGLWDVFDNEEACLFIRDRLSEPHFGARSLAMEAFKRGSLDNITVMVVNFEKRQTSRIPLRRESFA